MEPSTATDIPMMRVIRNTILTPNWVTYLKENGEDSIQDLDLLVCEVFKIDPDKLFTRTRKQEIKDARYVYFYVMNEWFGYSLKAIDRITTWSHCDVFHGVNVVKGFIENEYPFREKMMRLGKIIDQSLVRVPQDPKIEENAYNLVFKRHQLIQSSAITKSP